MSLDIEVLKSRREELYKSIEEKSRKSFNDIITDTINIIEEQKEKIDMELEKSMQDYKSSFEGEMISDLKETLSCEKENLIFSVKSSIRDFQRDMSLKLDSEIYEEYEKMLTGEYRSIDMRLEEFRQEKENQIKSDIKFVKLKSYTKINEYLKSFFSLKYKKSLEERILQMELEKLSVMKEYLYESIMTEQKVEYLTEVKCMAYIRDSVNK